MALIQAKWPKSGQNLGIRGHNIGQIRGQNAGPRAILLRFGPYCLDLGYLAEFESEYYLGNMFGNTFKEEYLNFPLR